MGYSRWLIKQSLNGNHNFTIRQTTISNEARTSHPGCHPTSSLGALKKELVHLPPATSLVQRLNGVMPLNAFVPGCCHLHLLFANQKPSWSMGLSIFSLCMRAMPAFVCIELASFFNPIEISRAFVLASKFSLWDSCVYRVYGSPIHRQTNIIYYY